MLKNAKQKKSPRRKHSFFARFGLSEEKQYFVENFALLISSGMGVLSALEAVKQDMRSQRMRTAIDELKEDIDAGSSLWRALETTRMFPMQVISLIRVGEESGRLTENLKVVALQEQKERIFKSKVRSAMLYPVMVLSLTLVIGIGISWFILPKLATVFDQMHIKLPLITKLLIGFGIFLGKYGSVAVPVFIVLLGVSLFFIFVYDKTKFIGEMFLFHVPGVKQLMQETELARFGFILGTLLSAGLPISEALQSLRDATGLVRYRRFYAHLEENITEGNSFQKSFLSYKKANKLIPTPIQQLVFSGEQSGSLSETLVRIGATYEEKTDTTTKNLSVVLEPILLVIVWLGVVGVAMAVILPIYSLVGDFNANPGETQSGGQ